MIEKLSPEARTFLSDFLSQIEYEKDKEIERLQEDIGNSVNIVLHDRKEIDRLNNIINELEHHLYQEWLEWKDSDCESIYSRAGEDKAIYDYLQELKGSDKE